MNQKAPVSVTGTVPPSAAPQKGLESKAVDSEAAASFAAGLPDPAVFAKAVHADLAEHLKAMAATDPEFKDVPAAELAKWLAEDLGTAWKAAAERGWSV